MSEQPAPADAKERRRPWDGYTAAFYELGKLMGIPAQAASPSHVWKTQMLPRLRAAFPSADQALEQRLIALNGEFYVAVGTKPEGGWAASIGPEWAKGLSYGEGDTPSAALDAALAARNQAA
jgi:hypothetical protein